MDLTHEAIKMAGALVLVIVVLLSVLAVVRRMYGERSGIGGEPLMRVLAGLRLGTGKQIMLVDIAGEILVLGTTAREMTLLTKITDEHRAGRVRVLTEPVAGRIGTWIGQWSSKKSEQDAASSSRSAVGMSNCS